jgi:hypothetical protein
LEIIEDENDRDSLLEICDDEGINVDAALDALSRDRDGAPRPGAAQPGAPHASDIDTSSTRIFDQVDLDGSGAISFDEFAQWWSRRQLTTHGSLNDDAMKKLQRAWGEADADRSGELDRIEFSQVLQNVASQWQEAQWQEAHDPITGRAYFYNTSTRETKWVQPDSDTVVEQFLKVHGVGRNAVPRTLPQLAHADAEQLSIAQLRRLLRAHIQAKGGSSEDMLELIDEEPDIEILLEFCRDEGIEIPQMSDDYV